MDVERLTEICSRLPGAWPDNPWEHEHPVFKVGPGERGKIFAFLGSQTLGIKAAKTREEADEWLRRYPDAASVMPYIGRSGWNDLSLAGAIADEELLEALVDSYRMVLGGLPKKFHPDGWDEVTADALVDRTGRS